MQTFVEILIVLAALWFVWRSVTKMLNLTHLPNQQNSRLLQCHCIESGGLKDARALWR